MRTSAETMSELIDACESLGFKFETSLSDVGRAGSVTFFATEADDVSFGIMVEAAVVSFALSALVEDGELVSLDDDPSTAVTAVSLLEEEEEVPVRVTAVEASLASLLSLELLAEVELDFRLREKGFSSTTITVCLQLVFFISAKSALSR